MKSILTRSFVIKLTAVCIIVLWANAVMAEKCALPDVLSKAKNAFVPLFQDPPDMSGTSAMPFVGVLKSVTRLEDGSISLLEFEVKEIFFDVNTVLAEKFGASEPPVTIINVVAIREKRFPPGLNIGTEWLVVASKYGSRNGVGRGDNPRCGEWLGAIKDGRFHYNPSGDHDPHKNVQIPWAEARNAIMAPITTAGQEGRERLIKYILENYPLRKK